MIRSLASPPFSECFTRLRADTVKSQQLRHPSVGASRRQCEELTWLYITCLPRFHSTLCRSSSSSQHSDRLEPQSSCWGEPFGGIAISLQYTVSLVKWVNHLLPILGVSSLRLGDAQTHKGLSFSCWHCFTTVHILQQTKVLFNFFLSVTFAPRRKWWYNSPNTWINKDPESVSRHSSALQLAARSPFQWTQVGECHGIMQASMGYYLGLGINQSEQCTLLQLKFLINSSRSFVSMYSQAIYARSIRFAHVKCGGATLKALEQCLARQLWRC